MQRMFKGQYFKKIVALFFLSLIYFFSAASIASKASAQALNIAVIESDGGENAQDEIFKSEIKALFDGTRDVRFISYPINENETPAGVRTVFNTASANQKTDVVLVLDIAANQSLGLLGTYSKPTFLPYVFNAQLTGLPLKNETSGKRNLNYLTFSFDFEKELKTLQSVAPFKKAALISNPRTKASLNPEMLKTAKAQAKNSNVDLEILAFTGDSSALNLAAGTDAVLYGFTPNVSREQKQALIDDVNARGLVSFSLTGAEDVQRGALATNVPTADWEKLARRTALHIEEVLLGAPASSLPVFFESSNRLMINMATSRQIRVAPSFDVLSEAMLINELETQADRVYSLQDVAHEAVRANLSLAAQRLQSASAEEAVKEVRSGLLPQINSAIDFSARKDDTAAVLSGTVAENSTDGSLSLTQPLFVEELWAALTIQKFSTLSEQEVLKEVELDIVQAAVNTYLNVLLEKTSLAQARYNLDITRENYRLAQNRVSVGAQTAADLYRWESELASAKQEVLRAKSDFEQQKQQLNQLLNRPIKEEFGTTIETLNNPLLLISDPRITTLIKNTYDLDALSDYFVDIGLERAPELKQTEASMQANKRQLASDKRAYWLPDLNFTSEVTSNFDEDRATGASEGEDTDWRVGVELSLPLFEGGARSARAAQSRLAVKQLETNLADLKNQIEQDIRNTLEDAHASYNSIPLAQQAETAAQKNYALINDSYAQGAKSITDVLDAQESLITAREASMNAVYAFLIDLMNLQRAIGAYDFFLTDNQRLEFSDDLIQRLKK